jgi:prevent-host-death family protein
MITKTSAEAQNQFGQLLDTVQREPVVITRHGRPAALMVSPREIEDFQAMRNAKRKQLAADWAGWSELTRKNMKPEAEELTDEDIVRLVHELR